MDKTLVNDLKKATYFVELFEKKVAIARGKALDQGPGYEGKEAMKRVKALAKSHGGEPGVQELVDRVKVALKSSKGQTSELKKEHLAYLDIEARAKEVLVEASAKVWEQMLEERRNTGVLHEQTFPVPPPYGQELQQEEEELGEVVDLMDKFVVIEGVDYPTNEMMLDGQQLLFAGSPEVGYYFIDLSDQDFKQAYRALRRVRDTLLPDVTGTWEVLGRVKGRFSAIPSASREPVGQLAHGWLVDVDAIRLPSGVVVAEGSGPDGLVPGEQEARETIEAGYTYRTLPPDDAPADEVVRCAVASIKEKNWELFVQCVDSSWTATPTAESRLRYRWERNQELLRDLYVHMEPGTPEKLRVLKGERIDEDESFFLDEEDIEEILGASDPLLEEIVVPTRRINARGRQEGTPNPVFLRRTEEGPWRIWSGIPI